MPGCGHQPPPSPEPMLRRYMQALVSDNPRGAYQLLDGPTQEKLPYPRFLYEWRNNPTERAEQAAALKKRLAEPVTVHAVVKGGARQATFLWVPGRTGSWVLLDPDLRAARPESPEEALRILVAAADERSYEAVLRVLSPSQRALIETELRERIGLMRAALSRGRQAEVNGNTARYEYDPRFHVELRKEQGAWWVVDLN